MDTPDFPETVYTDPARVTERVRRLLADRPSAPPDWRDLIAAIDRVAHRWQHPTDPERLRVIRDLHTVTGLHPTMLERILDVHLDYIRAEQLQQLLRSEFGDPDIRSRFVPYGNHPDLWVHVTGSGLRVWWMPGNLPGPALLAVVFSVLTGGPFLIRVSRYEPVLAPAFWHALLAERPDLASLGAIAWWSHEDTATTRTILARADTVIAYGHESTLDHLRTFVPGTARWLPYPHRISFAAIDRTAYRHRPIDDLAMHCAEDIAWFDQQGCMSPHVIYLEGSPDAVLHFGDALARALDHWEQRWPRRTLSQGEAMRVQSFRARWIGMDDTRIWMGANTTWTVVYTPQPDLAPTCTYRTVFLKPIADLKELPEILHPHRHHLQTMGYAIDRSWTDLALQLARLGVKRFCPIGRMQRPPLVGCHDGRPRLIDLVTYVQWEGREGKVTITNI